MGVKVNLGELLSSYAKWGRLIGPAIVMVVTVYDSMKHSEHLVKYLIYGIYLINVRCHCKNFGHW